MMHEHFRQAIVDLDVALVRKIWGHTHPHLPQGESDENMLIALHHARTIMESIHLKHRAYSHAWLRERRLPSGLPDHLKPAAEKLYPVITPAVGITVKVPAWRHEHGVYIREKMEEVVQNCFADGKIETSYVKPRMLEARELAKKKG